MHDQCSTLVVEHIGVILIHLRAWLLARQQLDVQNSLKADHDVIEIDEQGFLGHFFVEDVYVRDQVVEDVEVLMCRFD